MRRILAGLLAVVFLGVGVSGAAPAEKAMAAPNIRVCNMSSSLYPGDRYLVVNPDAYRLYGDGSCRTVDNAYDRISVDMSDYGSWRYRSSSNDPYGACQTKDFSDPGHYNNYYRGYGNTNCGRPE